LNDATIILLLLLLLYREHSADQVARRMISLLAINIFFRCIDYLIN